MKTILAAVLALTTVTGLLMRTALAADFSVGPLTATYDGNPHSVRVAPAAGVTGMGSITVLYNGSAAAPTSAGSYALSVNVADGPNYDAATGFLGTFTINQAMPVAGDFSFNSASATYNGSPHGVVVTAASTITGAVTARYAGSTTMPTDVGTYAITVDVAADGNYAAASNLSLGQFTINQATPVADDFRFGPASVTYNGSPQGVIVTAARAITGAVTVRYAGSTTMPTNAGTYPITVDVAANGNYTAASNLSLGQFTIDKAAPAISPATSPAISPATSPVTSPAMKKSASAGQSAIGQAAPVAVGAAGNKTLFEVRGDGQPDRAMPPWTVLVPQLDGWKMDCCNHAKTLHTNLVMYQGEWTGKAERMMILFVWPSGAASLESSLQADRENYLKNNPSTKISPFPVANSNGLTCQGVLYEGRERYADLDDAVAFCEPQNKSSGLQLSWSVTVAKNDPMRQQILASFRDVVKGSVYTARTSLSK